MQVLILGCNEQTHHIAPCLVDNGHHVTILARYEKCIAQLSHQISVEIVQRTGDLMENLQNCHIDNIDVFLALSENDNENAMAAQIASRIFNIPIVICHINEVSKHNVYKDMGLNVVSSTVMVAETILQTLEGKS